MLDLPGLLICNSAIYRKQERHLISIIVLIVVVITVVLNTNIQLSRHGGSKRVYGIRDLEFSIYDLWFRIDGYNLGFRV